MMNETQPVDLISPEMPQAPQIQMPQQQQQQPYTPPTPVPPPSINTSAKQFAKSGQPVIQETYTKQSIWSPGANPESVVPSMLQTPGTTKKEQDKIQYIASLYLDPNCQEWSLQIDRIGPARTAEGAVLSVGQVQMIRPPIPYPDAYERVKSLNGGGRYILRVLDENGVGRYTLPFSIDTNTCPPIPTIPNNGSGYRVVGGPHNAGSPFSQGFAGEDELFKIRSAEQVARANKSLKVAEFEAEETDRVLRKRRDDATEADERKRTAPFETAAKYESERLHSGFKSELREMQYGIDRQINLIQQNFEKLIITLGNQQKPNNDGNLFLLMGTMFKGMSDSTTAMMTAVMAKDNGSKGGSEQFMEALKMVSASTDKTTNMLMQSALAASTKNDALINTLITNKMEHPENAVKTALEMRESGYKQAMDMFDRFESLRGNNEPEDVINPEGGFWSNFGNVILAGLQGLVTKGAKGGGKMAMDAIGAILQKPAGTTQFSQQDLQRATDILVAQEMAKRGIIVPPPAAAATALPAPQMQQPQPPQQQQQPRQQLRLDPRKIFDRIYETEDIRPAAPIFQPVQLVQQAPIQIVPQQPLAEEMEEVVPQQQQQLVPQPQQVPEPQIEEEEEEEGPQIATLGDYVNQMIEIALEDLRSGRKEHDWVEFALSKWDSDFLDALVAAPRPSPEDISAQINMIQTLADPELYNQLYQTLVNPKNAKLYAIFLENFSDFLSEIKEPSGAATK